jgi:cytochrome P450
MGEELTKIFCLIGSVTMDVELNAQLAVDQQSDIIKLYRQLGQTYLDADSFKLATYLNVPNLIRQKVLSRKLDRILKELVKEQYSARKMTQNTQSRSVLSLSLQDIDDLDEHSLAETVDQLKSFLFAGHDTTSTLLQWAFYELSRTPRAMEAIRKELDEIFGPDSNPRTVRKLLIERGDELIPKLAYTSAVIKETLRLYPPAATARRTSAGAGCNVKFPSGEIVCLDGPVLYLNSRLVHRDPAVYGETRNSFVPERWLGDTDTSMETNGIVVDEKLSSKDDKKVPASAWRPFERGPRNCIGQELANIEARVILASTLRRYAFTKSGLGATKLDGQGMPTLGKDGQYLLESEMYNVSRMPDIWPPSSFDMMTNVFNRRDKLRHVRSMI